MFQRRMVLLALCLLAFCAAAAEAGRFASLAGTLRDAEGMAVKGAAITLREVTTGRRFDTFTGEDGGFSFPRLPAGTYDLSVRRAGLQGRLKGIRVMPRGGMRASVTITQDGRVRWRWQMASETGSGDGSGSNPQPSTGGESLTGKQVSKLPLNGRDFGQLLLLAAGTMTDTNGAANFTQQYAVNGQRGTTAIFAVDGIDVTDPELGGATFDNFNTDAIQEIKSSSGVMPASIGEGAASFTDIITNSGGSEVHGDVFEFFRNSSLDARNFFDRRSLANPGRLPHFERNEFGFTNGGPLVLPGIYNGRHRTYYFGEYQGFQQILGTTQILSVPTGEERLGLDTTAFPGDTLIVPVSPAIAPVLARYPLPNDREGPYSARTYATSAAVTTVSNQFSFRIDHTISSKAKVFSRFSFDDTTGPTTNPSQVAIDPSFGIRFFNNQRNFALAYTRAFTPHLTSASSAGYIRSTPVFPPINKTQPGLVFGDGLYEPFNSAAGTVTGAWGNLLQLKQSWTYVRGRNTWGWGAEVRLNRDTTVYGISPNGLYTFGGGTAYSPGEISSASGQHNILRGEPLPDALTGLLTATPYSYTSSIAYPIFPQGDHIGESAIHRDEYNFYLQDEWKARHNLTVNYGLRYEVGSPIREPHHLTSAPVFLAPGGSFAPAWQKGVQEEVLFYPQPPNRYSVDWGGWGPRLSLAWQATKQTVFRAGAGITTILPNLYQENFLTGDFPFQVPSFISATPGAPVPFVNGPLPIHLPALYTPAGAPVFAAGNSMSVPANTVMDVDRFERDMAAKTPGGAIHPIAISGMSRDFQNGYIETYTAEIEHRFHDLAFDAAYVGTEGVKLASIVFPNSYPGASPAFAPFTLFNPAGQVIGGYGSEDLMSNRSHSTYSALQTSATKTSPRWGLGFQLSYTYSKALDDSSAVLGGYNGASQGVVLQPFPQNPWDPGADRGPATFDLTQVFTASLIQNLRLDRISFLRDHLGQKLTSGWQFLNISTITSGPPFSILSGIQQTGAGSAGADRPDEIRAPVLSTSRTVREDYFGLGAQNASFFRIPIDVPGGTGPNDGRFGVLGRDTFRGPGFQEYDVALIKDTGLGRRGAGEAVTLEFRSEFFNIFNLTNFGLPANIVRGSGFGIINHTAGASRQLQFSLKLIY